MTDEPEMVGPAPRARMVVPAQAEERKRVQVRLVGGPFHDQTFSFWAALKRIEMAWSPDTTPPEAPPEDARDVEHRPAPTEPLTLTVIYTRESEDATEAVFAGLEI